MNGHDNEPQCTLFVGNISEQVTEEILFELFLQAGPLKNISIPKDKVSKKPRNFAFVTFKHHVSVEYAIKLFNGIKLFNMTLNLNKKSSGRAEADHQSPADIRTSSPHGHHAHGLQNGFARPSPGERMNGGTPLHSSPAYMHDPSQELLRRSIDRHQLHAMHHQQSYNEDLAYAEAAYYEQAQAHQQMYHHHDERSYHGNHSPQYLERKRKQHPRGRDSYESPHYEMARHTPYNRRRR